MQAGWRHGSDSPAGQLAVGGVGFIDAVKRGNNRVGSSGSGFSHLAPGSTLLPRQA